MTDKQTYWISDAEGALAVVAGREERDRWIPLGWSDADEPGPDDWVWLRHDEHGGSAKFPAAVAPGWEGRGWKPGPPPEPVDLTKDTRLSDPPPPDAPASAKAKGASAKAASSDTKGE